ncbi:MAG: hypothetical protein ACAI35_20885 [Candidatus Methylacidiphilales bacterium]
MNSPSHRRFARIALLPSMVLFLCLFSASQAHAVGDITKVETWYEMLNLPKYFIDMGLLVTACGFVFICVMLTGITRAVMCIGFCMAFICYTDPQTLQDPIHRYPYQMTKLQERPDKDVRMWALAHTVMIFFVVILAICVNNHITNRKVEIKV